MRPVSLKMKAFGSFAKETTISFESFPNGLYLVVGETGAGKTTIFDAIVFALFGAASGSNRKPEMMHSDYEAKSEDTEVCLIFDHAGKRYTVKRKIHFRKKRGKVDEYGDGTLSADLILPEGQPVTGHAAVTKRCEDLLGLSADQFRKIVMLAQGEFREFLASDSGKKSEILGKLFDSSEYVRYQNLLGNAKAALEEKCKHSQSLVAAIMNTMFYMPSGDDRMLYNASNPNLIDNLDHLIERDAKKTKELLEKKTATQKYVDKINTRKGSSESSNQKIDELRAEQNHDKKLQSQAGEMVQLSSQYKNAETALHKVRPVQSDWLEKMQRLKQAKADIQSLNTKLSTLQEGFDLAKAAVDGDAEVNARIEEINEACRRIKESLPSYTNLKELQNQLSNATNKAKQIHSDLESAKEQRDEKSRSLDKGKSDLLSLKNADANVVLTQTQYQKAQNDAEELIGKSGIKSGVEAIQRDEKQLALDEKKLSALTKEASQAENTHHQKYQAFINGQAGLMAADLTKELLEKGSARCPVCRALHRAGEAHDFAQYDPHTPTEAEVNKAKRDYDRIEAARQAQQRTVDRQKADLKSRKNVFISRTKKVLLDCGSWEKLVENGYLDGAIDRFEKAKNDAKLAYDDARQKKDRKDELEKTCDGLVKALNDWNQRIADCADKYHESEKVISTLSAKVESLKGSLQFKTLEEAKAAHRALSSERETALKRVNDHKSAFEAAKEEITRTSGELKGKEKDLPDMEMKTSLAREAFDRALAANGFAGEDALNAALAPVADTDGEEWLAGQRKRINNYKNDCANTAKRIRALTEQTKGLRYTDLDELEKELKKAKDQYEAADLAYTNQKKLLDNHKDVRKKASLELDQLIKNDHMLTRLRKLADLAQGANTDGGKLSFERYVMGAIFREVLEMANRRLDIMSGGRYFLVHSLSAGRANAAAGLEIEVLDIATGKQRAANSLSGGESFQVSLSLALGLSDVVQYHAGGIGLDTLFIDEGFGALDDAALDNAITVLKQLTEGNRLVGIISHVDKLEASIPQKLRVKKTPTGSTAAPELS